MPRISCWCLGVLWLSSLGAATAQTRTPLSSGEALYPRVLRVAHNAVAANNGVFVASVTTFPSGSGEEHIFQSPDGATFAQVGTIADPAFSAGLCCGTLYELPIAIGALPAGTLLWAGSVGGDTPTMPMQIRIYRSADRGVSWTYLSNCATATVNRSSGGLWEPQFTVASTGELICFYSDETVVGFSQLIQAVHSADSLSWSTPTPSVASAVQADRPGMAVVTPLPNGRYFMTYELCGPAACVVNAKTSSNGVDWTPAGDLGSRIQTGNNQWFEHTPTNAWSPAAGLTNGRLYVVGQILIHNGAVDPDNGKVVFVNNSIDGSSPWTTLSAPVKILNPPATSNVCQNYSSPLLPSTDGTSVLELASDYDSSSGTQICKTFFASGSTSVSPGFTLSVPNITTSATSSATATITLTPNTGYRGTVSFVASIPGFAGKVTVAPAQLIFTSDSPATAVLSVTPTPMAAWVQPNGSTFTASGHGPILIASSGAGGGAARLGSASCAILMGAIGLSRWRRRRYASLGTAIVLTLALADCGGGSSSPSVPSSSTYTGTLTASDVSDAAVNARTTFVVTVTH